MSASRAERVFVVASANSEKAKEMTEILSTALPGDVLLHERPADLSPTPELGSTLEENATLKAREVRDATGTAAIADDTGLEVAALGGRPGVFTARYAGPSAIAADNIARLLEELDGMTNRSARFRTVVVAALPDGKEIVAEGILDGEITTSPRGTGGFGYDPVFVPEGADGRTLAELDSDEKHALSHRGRALRALAKRLENAR
ncbi:MAG: RdgB/HAM1 family non-canonical purine NTP pyrophosphatase [Acidimicrobiales bacterium]